MKRLQQNDLEVILSSFCAKPTVIYGDIPINMELYLLPNNVINFKKFKKTGWQIKIDKNI